MEFTSSGLIVLGKSVSKPVSIAASVIRRIARPNRQTDRPAAVAASANVFKRAMFEANVVATTIPGASRISPVTSSMIDASERPAVGEKMFVLSQTSALTPSFATSAQSASSNGSPQTGVRSILKSPEWMTRPSGLSITSPALSGIEWLIGT